MEGEQNCRGISPCRPLSCNHRKHTQLRKLKGVHGPGVPITGMAYSHRLSKIVTCSGNAEVRSAGNAYLHSCWAFQDP